MTTAVDEYIQRNRMVVDGVVMCQRLFAEVTTEEYSLPDDSDSVLAVWNPSGKAIFDGEPVVSQFVRDLFRVQKLVDRYPTVEGHMLMFTICVQDICRTYKEDSSQEEEQSKLRRIGEDDYVWYVENISDHEVRVPSECERLDERSAMCQIEECIASGWSVYTEGALSPEELRQVVAEFPTC